MHCRYYTLPTYHSSDTANQRGDPPRVSGTALPAHHSLLTMLLSMTTKHVGRHNLSRSRNLDSRRARAASSLEPAILDDLTSWQRGQILGEHSFRD